MCESVQGLQEELRDQATDVCEQLQNIHIISRARSSPARCVWSGKTWWRWKKTKTNPLCPKLTQKNSDILYHRLSPLPSVPDKHKIRHLSHKEEVPTKIQGKL